MMKENNLTDNYFDELFTHRQQGSLPISTSLTVEEKREKSLQLAVYAEENTHAKFRSVTRCRECSSH